MTLALFLPLLLRSKSSATRANGRITVGGEAAVSVPIADTTTGTVGPFALRTAFVRGHAVPIPRDRWRRNLAGLRTVASRLGRGFRLGLSFWLRTAQQGGLPSALAGAIAYTRKS